MKNVKDIDVSDWSVVTIDVGGGYLITLPVLHGKDWLLSFCDDYDYTLVGFQKGTNPYCQ